VRQIYPEPAVLTDHELADLYSYPVEAAGLPCWLRANMVTSLDGAATVGGRTSGLSGQADQQVFAMLRALADVIVVGAGTARVEGYRPVRPGQEGLRWTWLRNGRTPSPPIAVITRRLDLDLASPLLAGSPDHARTIVITTEATPPGRRAQAAATADVIIAGRESVDIVAAITALAGRGHRRILTEGGPYLLSQIIEAGLLDDLCLTLSPVLAGPGADRIAAGLGPPRELAGVDARQLSLAHVLADDGHLLCRYVRPGAG
jgi:riboflavin biosynthesis pyrimidine reductase